MNYIKCPRDGPRECQNIATSYILLVGLGQDLGKSKKASLQLCNAQVINCNRLGNMAIALVLWFDEAGPMSWQQSGLLVWGSLQFFALPLADVL